MHDTSIIEKGFQSVFFIEMLSSLRDTIEKPLYK